MQLHKCSCCDVEGQFSAECSYISLAAVMLRATPSEGQFSAECSYISVAAVMLRATPSEGQFSAECS